jgi:hypothetical protein
MSQNSYAGNGDKDPYTGKRYDFNDFDDVSSKNLGSPTNIIPAQ